MTFAEPLYVYGVNVLNDIARVLINPGPNCGFDGKLLQAIRSVMSCKRVSLR